MKTYIKKSGKTQLEWAQMLGIGASYMSLLVNGHEKPSLKMATRIERLTKGKVPASSWIDDDLDGT